MACDSRRPTGNTYRDVRIHHNVFTGTRASALWLQDVPGGQARPRGNVARNNIVLRGADGATFDIGDPGRWSFSHNALPDGLPGGLACRGGRQAGPGGRLGPVEHPAAGAAEHRRPRALRRRPPDYT